MGVVANLIVRVGADIEGFEKKMASLEKSAQRQGAKLQGLGSKLTMGLTAPLVGVGVAAVVAAQQIDDALDKIRIGTGATGSDLDGLGQVFRKVFGSVPASMDDAATAVADLNTRTGRTGKGLEEMSVQMLNLARITKSDVTSTIAGTTRVFGDWSISTDKQSGALDFLFKTSQATGAGLQSLTDNVVKFGAPMRQLGFSFEESVALLGKWEKEGVNTEKVLGSLTIGVGRLAKEGVSSADMARVFRERLEGIGTSATPVTAAIKLFGAKAGPDMAAAIKEGRFAVDGLVAKLKASPETINGAAKATDGFAEKFVLLKNKATLAIEPIGVRLMDALDRLMPAALKVAGVVTGLADRFSRLSPTTQTVIFGVVGLAAALGPLLWISGKVMITYGALAGAAAWAAKALGIKTLATKTATTANLGLAGSLKAAALAAAMPLLIVGSVVALGFAAFETAKGVRNLWAAWKEGTFLKTLFAKEDDNFARRWLGLSAPSNKGAGFGKDISLSEDPAAAMEREMTALLATLGAGGTGGSGGPAGEKSPLQKKLEGLRQSAKDLVVDAQAWGARIKELGGITRASEGDQKSFHGALQAVVDQYGSLKAAGLGALDALYRQTDAMVGKTAEMSKAFAATVAIGFDAGLLGRFGIETAAPKPPKQIGFGSLHNPVADGWMRGLAKTGMPSLSGWTSSVDFTKLGPKAVEPFREAFKSFGESIPSLIADAFKNGKGMAAIGGAIATGLAATFAGRFQSQMGDLLKQGKGVAEKFLKENPNMAVMGGIGVGASALIGGYSMGASSGKAKGALGGAASGAMAGAAFGSVVPGIGTALGAVAGGAIGAIGGLFGGRSKDKKDKAALGEDRAGLIAHFGGLDTLKKMADEAGFSVSKLLSTKEPKAFAAEVENLNKALEAKKARWEGIALAIEGVNARAAALMGPLQAQFAAMKALREDGSADEMTAATARMKQMAVAAQPEFERLGQFATAAFAGAVREGMTAMEALRAIGPTLDALKTGVTDFGLQGTEAITRLLGMRELVAVHQAEFDALAANQQMLKGFGDAGIMTRDLFVAFGQDTAAQFAKIADRGGDVNQAMALSQPILQQLWEGQKKYGAFTDEATQKLLHQAEEQGLVGDHMKGVNEKILDVLLAIGDALGAKIPNALKTFRAVADSEGGHVIAKGLEVENAWMRVADRGIRAPMETAFGDIVRSAGVAADDMQRKFDGLRARIPLEVAGGKIQFSGKGEGDDYSIDVSGHSYREGTRGRYVDFGAGTLAMLHGQERVVTKAEGRAESAGTAAMEQRLVSIERALRDQPAMMYRAIRDAAQQGSA